MPRVSFPRPSKLSDGSPRKSRLRGGHRRYGGSLRRGGLDLGPLVHLLMLGLVRVRRLYRMQLLRIVHVAKHVVSAGGVTPQSAAPNRPARVVASPASAGPTC